MRDKGIAHIGIGVGSGEDKAVDAIKSAMESPLLETTVSGATDIIINSQVILESRKFMRQYLILQKLPVMRRTLSLVM